MNRILSFFIITSLMLLNAAFAQVTFSDMQNLSNEYGPSNEHDLAGEGSNYYLVWDQWGDIMFRKSNNSGQNWGEKLTLYSGIDYLGKYPVVAVGGNNIYITYYRNTSDNSEIFMVKSIDGGVTFGNEVQITNSIRLAQVPQIVASGDTVLVAYEDRDVDYKYQIFLIASTDGGATWSTPQNLSQTLGHARWCNLAMQDQKLAVSWNEQTGSTYNELDVFVTTSSDFGATWSTPVNVTNDGLYNARLNTRLIQNTLFVIVSSNVDGLQTDVRLFRSDDFGSTWQPAVNLSDNTGASERPDLWVTPNFDNNYRLYAVWSDDTYTGNDQAYLKYSVDNGYSWSEMEPFSQATEDAAWVQIIGRPDGGVDELYTAWYRPNDGTFNYEVWGRAAQNQVSSDVNFSGIVRDENNIAIENAAVALGGYLIFSDSDGEFNLDVPAGTYDLSVSAAGFQNYSQPALELTEDTFVEITLMPLVPGNYPPHNLEIQKEGLNNVIATWEAPIGFGSIELAYDDGEANGLFKPGTATGEEFMAVGFQHNASCYLRQVKLLTSPGFAGETMKLWIAGDDAGAPDLSVVYGGPYLVAVEAPYTIVNMDIPIPQNVRFYAACQWEEGNLYEIGGDLNQPDGFSYSTIDGGQSWYAQDDIDFMIRAGIAFDQKSSPEMLLQPQTLLGYNVFLNGNLWGFTETKTALLLSLTPGMEHTIGVAAVYDDGTSPVRSEAIFIAEPLLFPPINLMAFILNYTSVNLEWQAPASDGEWMHWDDGENSDVVGGENIEIFDAAIRFTTDDLQNYDNQYLTRVSAFFVDVDCQIFIRVWQGGNQNYAGNLVREQFVTYPVPNEWNVIELDAPLQIDAQQELWIGYRVINPNGVYPAGTDDGPAIAFKGDMLLYGSNWVSMSSYFGWDINWNIQGYVVDNGTDATSSTIEISNSVPENIGEPQKITNLQPSQPFGWEYTHFNIYKNDVLLATTPPGELSYVDEMPENYNEYYVTTAWDEFESVPSNIVVVFYEGVAENLSGTESIRVHPNPVSGAFTITWPEAAGAASIITLTDLQGKIIATYANNGEATLELDADNLNGSRLQNGVYFIKIENNHSSAFAKIVVAR
ncbi:MAG TPA: T9SS type A sorting domain-containing protein [Bacteroidales bacterium]|nr:T9SS type A sorting domain-containing protein [Bacteroidales bacterium]